MYEVNFVTRGGVKSSVEIPKTKYTAEKAQAAVAKAAEELEATLTPH